MIIFVDKEMKKRMKGKKIEHAKNALPRIKQTISFIQAIEEMKKMEMKKI